MDIHLYTIAYSSCFLSVSIDITLVAMIYSITITNTIYYHVKCH